MAVASQVAMAAVAPARQTAAVARVFGGFALATVIGLPLGTLVGQAYGWHATFVLVAALAGTRARRGPRLLPADPGPSDTGGSAAAFGRWRPARAQPGSPSRCWR